MPFFLSLVSGFRCRCFSYARQPVRFWWFLITFFAGFKDFCALRTQSSNEKRIHQRRLEHRKGFFCTTQWCDSQTHTHIQMHLDHWKLRPWNEGKAKLWDERERGKKQQQQCAALAAEKASTKFWHCQRTQMLREFICDIDKHSQWEPLLNARIHNRSERERAMGAQRIHTANTVSETNTKTLCRYLLQSWRNTQTHSHSHTHTGHTLFRYGFWCFAALVVLCLFSVCAVYILGANYHRIQFLEHFHWDTKTHTNDDVSNMNHAHTP